MKIGMIGLGVMGWPMACNLVKSGADVVLWSRSPRSLDELAPHTARFAASPAELLSQCDMSILMLANADAIDEVLGRGTPAFAAHVSGRLIVNMGTTSPEYSEGLAKAIRHAGGRFVEAPVSGSRKPAIEGQLVGMLAGDEADKQLVRQAIAPLCKQVFDCGAAPGALRMKLSVNLYLITMVSALCEATHFAQEQGLDLSLFNEVLDASPMASNVSKMKMPKLVARDFSVQAAIADVLMNNQLVIDASDHARIATPMLKQSLALLLQTMELGHAKADMVAMLHALEAQTKQLRQ
jgi:3-hydroxyisobutyrate dehydrogenase